MPAGQSLGPRKKVAYETDANTTIRITTDATLADLAGSGLSAASGTTANKPLNFKPRGVYVQSLAIAADPNNGITAVPVLRKFIICNKAGSLYTSDTPQSVTIDGVAFTSTGRRGETQSF